MRRQTVLGGVLPAGSSGDPRLDPLALPVRFTARDAVADGRVRVVEIDQRQVRLRRSLRGMAIGLSLPIETFLGVSVRRVSSEAGETMMIRLEHRDPALALDLYGGANDAEVSAEWQLWAHVLGLPLLVADSAGGLHEPFRARPAAAANKPAPRRRRRNIISRRRPKLPLRRRPGDASPDATVHSEREIIARN
ncbi:MAG TPA: DUF6101 family protein [Xanthobacteraceae bacterium]|nr:DUF6101 family protein [Xanthobacteraceae bacterium]